MIKKKIAILGSTGSIGLNALKVIERFKDRFSIVALTAYQNHDILLKQAKKYSPRYVAASNEGVNYLKKHLNTQKIKVLSVEDDLASIASMKDIDIVVLAMKGSAALLPFLAAVRAGKIVAPANKEALVIAGDLIMSEAKKYGAKIIPVDSEQSAVFQCLEGQRRQDLKRVLLTASGGALRQVPASKFNRLSVEQILKHPRWKMGSKITVDSATLMNKGFEVIEAQRLFGLKAEEIEVLIHPEAIIHSMVEFKDGSVMAQLGVTDMRLPIQYALTYPERLDSGIKSLDFCALNTLHFEKPDVHKFPSLALALHVARRGGTLPCVLNASDEVAVEAFLNKKIKFTQIYQLVEKIVLKHKPVADPDLETILKVDIWAREETRKLI